MSEGLTAYALFCEDVREEASGQASLIGVFRGRMEVESFPLRLARLHVLIVVENDAGINGEHLSFEFSMPGHDQKLAGQAEIKSDFRSEEVGPHYPKRIEIQNIFEDFEVAAPGSISLELKIDGKPLLRQTLSVASI